MTTLYPALSQGDRTAYLYALFAGFMGVLGIVMAVLAILFGLMGPSYRALVEALPGGARRAMNPYQIVARGAAAGVLLSVLCAFGWPAMTGPAQIAALAASSGLMAWVTVGCAQLLRVTFDHATDSAEWDRQIANVRAAREQRLRDQ